MRQRRRMRQRKVLTRARNAPSVYRFKEMVQIGSLTAGAATDGTGRIAFKISDVTNWPHFKTLFDLYKITAVGVKLIPKWNVSDASIANASAAAGNLPMLYIAANRDPYVPAPVNAADVLNDDSCKIIRLTRPVNLFLKSPKPDITNGAGSIPLQFGVGSKFQPWLCTGGNLQTVDQENVYHYGFRWYISNGNGQLECNVDVYLTYYFSMKEQD